ncbi:5'-3' exoribonuclease 2 [Dendrobium catenatum]|uniref:5'-3' exoribonuclease 2 n=1 Tax=Dendrobium catenatum TaxID=906689 RepID=A0A2I0VML1_9ASPA|nr:5'-3' exoribonuclease 2 [Dendrobium catenatum]
MRNDQACHNVGVWSIFIRMHDGIVRELTDVRHVPYIMKKFMSVEALETKSYKVVIYARVLKIYHRVRRYKLYYLQGRIEIEMAIVAEDYSDPTTLWHM